MHRISLRFDARSRRHRSRRRAGPGHRAGAGESRLLVHVTDIDADAAAQVATEIGAGTRAAELDVRDEAACQALAAEVALRGPLDVWVNNAGLLVTGSSWTQDGATRRTMLEINTLGTMNGTVAAAIGKLTEHPRPILILPRWRGVQLRLLNLFPRLTVRVLGFAMRDARRKQRRYKRQIESGNWPK